MSFGFFRTFGVQKVIFNPDSESGYWEQNSQPETVSVTQSWPDPKQADIGYPPKEDFHVPNRGVRLIGDIQQTSDLTFLTEDCKQSVATSFAEGLRTFKDKDVGS